MKAPRLRFLAPYLVIGSISLALLHSASSASLRWNIPGPEDWFDIENWLPQLLPGSGDTVTIDNGATAVVDTTGLTATAGELYVGSQSGSGNLEIGVNGVLSDTNGYVGNRSAATVNVSGTWNNSTAVYVGGYFSSGTGTVNLLAGGTINSAYTRLGANGTGIVNVESGATWNDHTGVFDVGFGGKGILNLNGGTIYSGALSIGYDNSSVTINSGLWDANVTGQGYVMVGTSSAGTGTLTINGGSLKAQFSVVGNGGNGTAVITGGTWANTYQFFVGGYYYFGYYYGGTGSVTMTGGTISAYESHVAYGGSSGTVTITGGAWNNTNSIAIGVTGSGSLTLTGTGTVAITGGSTKTMTLATQAGSQGTLQIGNGDAFTGALNVLVVTGGAGAAAVLFKQTNSYTPTATFTGSLSIEQSGAGTTTLTKTNTYSGGTTVKAGKLLVNSTGGTGSGAVLIKSGGTLGGTGSIAGNLTIEGGGFLAPASSTFAVNGSISLLDDAWIVFRLGTVSDLVTGSGGLTLGADLTLDLTPVAGFGVGQYTLINYTGALIDNSSAFSDWTIVGLPASYQANFVVTSSALKVNVTAVPEPFTGIALAIGFGICLATRRLRPTA